MTLHDFSVEGLLATSFSNDPREAKSCYTHQAGNTLALDFVLRRADDPYDHVPSSHFLALLPDGEPKRRFMLDCTGCHQFDRRIVAPEGRPRSREEWHQAVDYMLSFAGADTNFPIMAPSRKADETAAWLATHLGTADGPLPAVAPPPPMTGAAAEIVITEYPFPATSDLPHDLMPDASGTIVITGMMTHQMYALDPATGVYTTTPIPVPFANPRALARFDPETETFREYELPIPDALPYIVRVHPTTGWICAKPPN